MSSYTPYSDEQLLVMLKNGCENSFTKIYDKYWKLVYAIAVKKLNSSEDAKELVQDVFVSLWNRREELSIAHSLKAYLSAAVKFKVYTLLAKQYRQSIKSSIVYDDLALPEIEAQISFKEMLERVNNATNQLPEKCRTIFNMSREEDLSHQEIANKLGISKKTVDNHIAKALKQMKDLLRPLLYLFI